MAAVIGALRAELSAALAQFEKDMGKAGDSVANFGKRFRKVGDNLQRVGTRMSVGITAPLAALGAASVKSFSDFQASMANVSTLVDTATEDMGAMERQVLAIARRTPVAMEDLTSALYDIRSAGIAAADAMNVLEGSSRLAVAGLGTTKEATDLVTSAINAFRLEGEEQERVYDTIFKTVKSGKTTISQLAQGFGAVAGTVANANVKLDEYLASVAALTTTGLPAAQAHTQIRAAIAGLTRETKETSAVFEQLGVRDFKGLVQQSGGMVAAFQRIVQAVNGNDAAIIKLVGSVEAYNAILGLTGSQNAAFESTLDGMRNGSNAVDEAFAKQNATFEATMTRLQNSMKSAAVSIGTVLVPVLEKLAGWLSQAADAFNDLSPGAQRVVVVVGALAAGIGPLLVVLGTMAQSIGALIPVLTLLGRTITILIASTGPIGLLIAAIGAVVAIWANWDTIGPIVEGMVRSVTEWLRNKLGAVLDYVNERVMKVIGVFKSMYDAVVGGSYVPDMVDGIAAEFARLPAVMVKPAEQASDAVGRAFEETGTQVGGLLQRLARDGELTMDTIRGAVDDLARDLFARPLFNQLSQSLSKSGGGFLSSLAGGLFSGFFADGGTIPRGHWGIVGERGPEPVFAGDGDLRVMPNGAAMAGGNVTQVFNITTPDANSFRLSQRQISRVAKQRLQGA